MLQIEIRQGTAEDAVVITDLIKKMVLEMAQYGGHEVNENPAVWYSMEEIVKANSTRQEHLYLIARQEPPEPIVIGMAAANIEPLENIFATKTRLHQLLLQAICNFSSRSLISLCLYMSFCCLTSFL